MNLGELYTLEPLLPALRAYGAEALRVEILWCRFIVSMFLLWPVTVFYLIRFNRWRDRSVCVRLTSQCQIEASGFTLDLPEEERGNGNPCSGPLTALCSQ